MAVRGQGHGPLSYDKLIQASSRAVGLSAMAMILVAGCSSGGGSAPSAGSAPSSGNGSSGGSGIASGPVSTPLPPRQLLLAAATQAEKITSATETLAIHDSGTQNMTITGTAQFQRTPTLDVAENLAFTVAGKSTDIKVILTGTAFYLSEAPLARQFGKPWLKLDLSALSTPTLAAFAQLIRSVQTNNFVDTTQLFAAASSVRVVGKQTVDGVPTTEYAGSFQTGELSRALASGLRKILAPALRALGNGTVYFHTWIDDQHRTRKLTEVETINGLMINTTVNITGINQPVQITIPPASQTFTAPGG